MMAFEPRDMQIIKVKHKDGNMFNNTYDNLEWATRAENMKHAGKL